MTGLISLRSFSLFAVLILLASLMTLFRGGATQASFRSGNAGLRQEALSNHDRALKKSSWSNEVVTITKLRVKKGEVEFDKKFTDDDDWLRGLTLTVKNISDKPVVFVEVTITLFSKGGDDETDKVPLGFYFSYGSDPAADVRDVSRLPRAIAPGDSAEMTLSEENYTRLRQMLFRENYPLKFKQVDVTIERVIFGDGMMWYKSYYFLRDPDNPNRWLRDKHFKKVGRSWLKLKKGAETAQNGNTQFGESQRKANPGCGPRRWTPVFYSPPCTLGRAWRLPQPHRVFFTVISHHPDR